MLCWGWNPRPLPYQVSPLGTGLHPRVPSVNTASVCSPPWLSLSFVFVFNLPPEASGSHETTVPSQTGKLRLIIKLLVQVSQVCLSCVLTPRQVSRGVTAWSSGSDPEACFQFSVPPCPSPDPLLTKVTNQNPVPSLSPSPWPTTAQILDPSLPSRLTLKEPGGCGPGQVTCQLYDSHCPSSQLGKLSPSPRAMGSLQCQSQSG